MSRHAAWRGFVSFTVLSTLILAGCTHWRRASTPYESHLPAPERHRVRVQLADGSGVILDSARVEGDSLIGLAQPSAPERPTNARSVRTSLALSQVHELEIRETDVAEAVVLVVAAALLIGTAIATSLQDIPIDTTQSCPLAHGWDGDAWRLESGTYGGAIMAPLARSQVDVLTHLRPMDGQARMRVASELDETDMVDAVELMAVDHPQGTTVAPDLGGRIRGLRAPVGPISVNTDPASALRFANILAQDAFLLAELETPTGWVTVGAVQEAGPEVMRRQVVPLDLGAVSSDTVRVRLTSTPSFWDVDRVMMDFGPEPSVSVRRIGAREALDQDGRDVSGLLAAAEREYFVGEKGDWVDLDFDVPPVPDRQERSYALATSGWYRIHTPALGEPQLTALRRIESESGFVSKFAVSRMNAALSLLAGGHE